MKNLFFKTKLTITIFFVFNSFLLFSQHIKNTLYDTLPKSIFSKYAIIYEKGDLKGAIGLDGKVIIEPSAKSIYKMDSLGGFMVVEYTPTKACGLLNGKGEMIVPMEYQNIEETSYPNRFIVKKSEKVGIIDEKNSIIVPIKNMEIRPQNNYFSVSKTYDSVAIVDNKGMFIFNWKEQKAFTKSGLIYEVKKNKLHLYDLSHKLIKSYDKAFLSDINEKLTIIKSNQITYFLNDRGEEFTKIEDAEFTSYFNENNIRNLTFTKKPNPSDVWSHHGIVGFDGKIILDWKYNEIQRGEDLDRFVVGKFIGPNKARYGLVINNKQVIDFKYPSLYWYKNRGVAKNVIHFESKDKNGNIIKDWKNYVGIINEKGDTLVPFIHKWGYIRHLGKYDAQYENQYWFFLRDTLNRSFVLDDDFNPLHQINETIEALDEAKGVFIKNGGKKHTIINYKNEIISELKDIERLSLIESLSKYGLFMAYINNKGYGIIDIFGNFIIEPQFDKINAIFRVNN